jgi:hypothetical protein
MTVYVITNDETVIKEEQYDIANFSSFHNSSCGIPMRVTKT